MALIAITSMPDEVRKLAEALRQKATVLGAGEAELDDLERAMVEAATNIVRHGYPPGAPGPIKLSVTRRGNAIRVDLFDCARPPPPAVIDILNGGGGDPIDPENIALDALPEGGMGLFLIGASVDQAEIERRHRVNRFRMIKMVCQGRAGQDT